MKFVDLRRDGVVSALAGGLVHALGYNTARGDNATGLERQVIAAVLVGGVSHLRRQGRAASALIAGALLIGDTAGSALRFADVSFGRHQGRHGHAARRLRRRHRACSPGVARPGSREEGGPPHTSLRSRRRRPELEGRKNKMKFHRPTAVAPAPHGARRQPTALALADPARAHGGEDRGTGSERPPRTSGSSAMRRSYRRTWATRTSTPVDKGGEEGRRGVRRHVQARSAPEARPKRRCSTSTPLTQQQIGAIVMSANDPNALCDALGQARDAGVKVSPSTPTPAPTAVTIYINQANSRGHRPEAGRHASPRRSATPADRDPVGTANATNQNAWIDVMKKRPGVQVPEHQARRSRLRQRRRPDVVRQDRGAAAEVPGPQGHHLADHRRHRRCCPVPVHLGVQGQGRADRSGHPEPDARLRQGRHRHRIRTVEPRGPRLPRRLRGQGPGRR